MHSTVLSTVPERSISHMSAQAGLKLLRLNPSHTFAFCDSHVSVQARLKLLRELKAEQELEKARESRVAQALHGDDTGASPAAQALLLSKQEEGEGGKGGDKQQEAGSETGEEAGIGDSLPGSPGSGELLQGVEQGFEEWSAEAGLDSVASGLGSSGANSTGAAGSGPEHSEL